MVYILSIKKIESLCMRYTLKMIYLMESSENTIQMAIQKKFQCIPMGRKMVRKTSFTQMEKENPLVNGQTIKKMAYGNFSMKLEEENMKGITKIAKEVGNGKYLMKTKS